ncbi:hypothetical protein EVAR_88494_1 [Eumeta japonica]|uniref:Uncharacterized protein n=1 Tax=Eumeta variegata TaxID=151549 RepID=A0A4C1XUX9_EUMVA|nr:hypothetical protein EVAR_88494_1 [Eumeta japonica]
MIGMQAMCAAAAARGGGAAGAGWGYCGPGAARAAAADAALCTCQSASGQIVATRHSSAGRLPLTAPGPLSGTNCYRREKVAAFAIRSLNAYLHHRVGKIGDRTDAVPLYSA